MGSPRMGPNLPYKPATPNRKTSHTRTSRSRKTSHTRTTRSSLFPLIIIHVRRYGESSRGPYHPWGRACARVCVSDCLGRRGAPSVADRQEDRKTGRQGGREDSPTHRAEQAARGHLLTLPAMPACLALPCLPSPISHHAHLPCLPTFPACRPCPLAHPTPFPAVPACVILSTGAPHAQPAKRPFVKPFYHFPIYKNVTR